MKTETLQLIKTHGMKFATNSEKKKIKLVLASDTWSSVIMMSLRLAFPG